ncbi:MAG: hypothetical protein QM703_27365 [Gemmatales bacterium]
MYPWIVDVRKCVERRQPPLFCVHYACNSLISATNQTSMVTAIAVRILGLDQTRVFSLGLMAEREGIAATDIQQHKIALEKALLDEFNCFLHRMNTKYTDAWWFHWAMRDVTFGWPILEHRVQTLLKVPLNINEERLVDIHASLAHDFGREFVARPQLLQLAELNGLAHADLLTGPVEVEALQRGDYLMISRSTAKKAEIIGQVVVKYALDRLITAGSKNRRRKRWSVVKEDALPRELIGAGEASRLCGVSRATWYRLLAGAKIPLPHKIGRRSLWDAKELRLWIDSSCPSLKRWVVERRLFGLGQRKS